MTHAIHPALPTPMGGRRRFLRAGSAGLAGLAALAWGRRSAAAQGEALRFLCSGPAGSIPDLVARAVGQQLLVTLDQPVVIDNRPGAAGLLSVGALKAAVPDGSTLLLAQGAIATVYPFLYRKLAYDPVADLQPVSLAAEMSLALAVGPAVPAAVTTLVDFLAWARQHPGQANLGSPGMGTLPHLLLAMLLRAEGVAWQHVAYSGGPPAVTAAVGGQIAGLVLPEGLLRQHHAAGRLRVLATSGPARSSYLPDVPSFAEQGHPDLVVKEWFAFFAAGRVSAAQVEARSAMLRGAIARPELAMAFNQAGMTPASSAPGMLAERIAGERRFWQPVLRANDIRAD